MGSEEARAFPRVDRLYFIAYVNREGEEQKTPVSMGRTVNISRVGVGMEVYQRLAVDSVMEMEIAVEEGRLLKIKGTVVHITSLDDDKFLAGIKFDEVQEGFGLLPV
jgi:hypothetical protein